MLKLTVRMVVLDIHHYGFRYNVLENLEDEI